MGIYVSKPVTDTESQDEETKVLKYGASSMQGWRTSQEDAHNSILEFDKDTALFAVYDGHGGHEVSKYTSQHFPAVLWECLQNKDGKIKEALIDGFLRFDQTLLKDDVLDQLKKIAASKKDGEECESTDSEDPEEISMLRKEAAMPISEVISNNYIEKNALLAQSCSPALRAKKDKGECSGYLPLDSFDDEEDSTKNDSNAEDATGASATSPIKKVCDGSSNKEDTSAADAVVNGDENASEDDCEQSSKVTVSSENEPEAVQISSDSDVKSDSASECNGVEKINVKSDDTAAVSKKENLLITGKRITPITLLDKVSKSKNDDSPLVTTKGKCGKGGKVKGSSALSASCSAVSEGVDGVVLSKVSRSSALDAKKLLTEELLDSEDDDEDDDDETFAVESSDENVEEVDEDIDVSSDDDLPSRRPVISFPDDEDDDDEDDDDDDDNDNENDNEDDVYSEFYSTMKDGPGFESGCTACVALLHLSKLYVANVGDSRCVVSRDGKAIDMSVDHKPEDDSENERIVRAGGKVTEDGRVNGGLNLSRAFGDHGYKQNEKLTAAEQMISAMPDIRVLELCKKDQFAIIACDGIWNSMTSQQAVDFVNEKLAEEPDAKLSEICEEMFHHCLAPDLEGDGTGCDNMTCIIVAFKDSSSFPEVTSDQPEQTNYTVSASAKQVSETVEENQTNCSKSTGEVAENKLQNGAVGSQNSEIESQSEKLPVKRLASESAEDDNASNGDDSDDRPGKRAKLLLTAASE